MVFDYLGIFKDLQRALSGNTAGVERGLIDLQLLRPRFADLMADTQETLAPIQPETVEPQPDSDMRRLAEGRVPYTTSTTQSNDRTARAIEYFWPEERREHFFKQFKELEAAYEVLSPDPFLYDYLADYTLIVDLYRTIHSYFDPQADQRRQQRDLLHKTEALIRDHITGRASRRAVASLPNQPQPGRCDCAGSDPGAGQGDQLARRSIIAHVQEFRGEQPYLISIGEEVERVIEQLRQNQISAASALETMQGKAEAMVQSGEAHAASNLDNLAFALRMTLKATPVLSALEDGAFDTLSTTLANYLQQHTGWPHNGKLESSVRMQLYKRLLPQMPKPFKPEAVNEIVNNLLKMHRLTL
ncbi:MAG: hypothetical protein R2932_50490 [Caldilineaceae bacterium]